MNYLHQMKLALDFSRKYVIIINRTYVPFAITDIKLQQMNIGQFDIINPLDGMIGKARHGPMHRFSFKANCPYSGTEVEQILRQYGVRVWGREMKEENERALLVKRSQAIWAEYVLCRAGVPLTCPMLDPRNRAYKEKHEHGSMPLPWTKDGVSPRSFVDHVVVWLDRLLG